MAEAQESTKETGVGIRDTRNSLGEKREGVVDCKHGKGLVQGRE